MRTWIDGSKQARMWGGKDTKAVADESSPLTHAEVDTGSLLRIAEATELLTLGHRALLDRAEKAEKQIVDLNDHVALLRGECRDAKVTIRRYRNILRWMMGEAGTFPRREKGVGLYWWRKSLRKRIEKAGS